MSAHGSPIAFRRRQRPAPDVQPRTLISRAQLSRPGGRRLYWTIVPLTVVLFTVAFVGPLYWMATGALKSGPELAQTPPTLVPHHPEFANYGAAWSKLGLGHALFNTFYYAFGALAFSLVFDVAAAYALSKLRPIFGNVVLGLMLAMLMIPSTVLIIPQYLTAIDLPVLHVNLLNSPFAIWLPAVANAFNVYLLKRFFDSIPEEVLDAASIDGAGPLRSLWSIVLPMSRPILGVVSVFVVTAVWKDFLWPLLVESTQDNKAPINVAIYAQQSGIGQNVIIAAAAIAAVPTIVFFLFFQRNIMAGLSAGSLKG